LVNIKIKRNLKQKLHIFARYYLKG